jgi:hypothetical protein
MREEHLRRLQAGSRVDRGRHQIEAPWPRVARHGGRHRDARSSAGRAMERDVQLSRRTRQGAGGSGGASRPHAPPTVHPIVAHCAAASAAAGALASRAFPPGEAPEHRSSSVDGRRQAHAPCPARQCSYSSAHCSCSSAHCSRYSAPAIRPMLLVSAMVRFPSSPILQTSLKLANK